MSISKRPATAVVVGAGPAGLMAADVLSAAGVAVTVVDRMPSVGRKFLMAGKSGLNLTKMEDDATFAKAYGAAAPALRQAIAAFGPAQTVAWAESLGQPVFAGSTGRVFPVAQKASPLLRAWLTRLSGRDVTVLTRWSWHGWADDGTLLFDMPDGRRTLSADATVLACGGGSWARLGSDGSWAQHIAGTAPFRPANCGFRLDWSAHMTPFLGAPVKATLLRAGANTSRGEWVITRDGIEGGGIYAVSAAVRDGAPLTVDLLPDVSIKDVRRRISAGRIKASQSQILRSRLRLPAVKVALINEVVHADDAAAQMDLPSLIKALPLRHHGPMPIDDAISTAGGLTFGAMNGFLLVARPATFAAGEMLDWEAPTGGYLLTACLATGRAAANAALAHLGLSVPTTDSTPGDTGAAPASAN